MEQGARPRSNPDTLSSKNKKNSGSVKRARDRNLGGWSQLRAVVESLHRTSPLQPPSQLILGGLERRVCKELAAHHQLERGAKTIVVDCNGQEDSRNENRHFHQAANLLQIYHKAVAPGYVTPRGCPFAELKTRAHFSLPEACTVNYRTDSWYVFDSSLVSKEESDSCILNHFEVTGDRTGAQPRSSPWSAPFCLLCVELQGTALLLSKSRLPPRRLVLAQSCGCCFY